MRVDFLPTGIHLPDLGLWLDPRQPVDAAWLSHAHSDHARGLHRTVLGTAVTLEIYRHRWPLPAGRVQNVLPVQPGESIEWNNATLTVYQAAHIVGAAQLLIEYEGERLLYTGDIKQRLPICGWPTQSVPCDRLIIESTFGLPIYHFLDEAEARRRIAAFAQETLAAGLTPVFQGYGLGRGQEITYALTQAGIPCAVHGAIAGLIPYYEAQGYSFQGWQPYGRQAEEPRALVITPNLQEKLAIPAHKYKVALVSGWARLDNARARSGADVLIPYSDHAGFDELLELVAASRPGRIDIVHGYAEPLARVLNQRGYNAFAAIAGQGFAEAQV